MSPTADGRHCAKCQTEVVDFTRLSDAEVLAYLAKRPGQHICGRIALPSIAPQHYKRTRGPLRWIFAALALFGWHSPAHAGPPQRPPLSADSDSTKPGGQVIVRGAVIDDQSGQPVAGARVLIKGTNFGTTTDETGRFELVMAATWKPLKSGKLLLEVLGNPFDFQPKNLTVAISRPAKPVTLTVRLLSIPNRGQVMGRLAMPEPPVKPPMR